MIPKRVNRKKKAKKRKKKKKKNIPHTAEEQVLLVSSEDGYREYEENGEETSNPSAFSNSVCCNRGSLRLFLTSFFQCL
ncbi:hypothetical protein CEXT_601891 [Caerostris extrusa]|uniref:Uncharacterized protein n=1 Tax=Caerostris extrusa TaxID=172846 RepID=A0AAV4NL76_CAEEX|nr:hypothetical protein CEXT_601891 [Caerostris extrusa]